MRKLFKTLFVLVLCLCISCVAFAEEEKDVAQIGLEYAEGVVAALAERAAEYAPKVVTLENGVQIQRTPSGSDAGWHLYQRNISYNNYYLNADNRGCAACHDLTYLSENLKGYPHLSAGNEMGIEVTVQTCQRCHDASSGMNAPDRFGELIHQAHNSKNKAFAAMGGDCWSCHYATDLGEGSEMKLWDNVKHSVMRGITRMSSDTMDGTFSWNQDKTLTVDQVFSYPWMARFDEIGRHGRELSGIKPDPETDGIYDSWTITVNGEVENPVTMTINEWIEAIGVDTTVMTGMCVINPMAGGLIANVEITGLDIQKMIDYCKPAEGVNAFNPKAWKNWNEPECTGYGSTSLTALEAIEKHGGYLVLEFGGEPIGYDHGYPAVAWIGGINASMYNRDIREITVSTEESISAEYSAGTRLKYGDNPYINVPTAAIAELAEGQIIPVGEPHVFEGYAHGVGKTIKTIELSFDQGATWVVNEVEDDDLTRWVWWNYEWTPQAPGSYTIMIRATTDDGYVSEFPFEVMFNAQVM